MFALIDCNNFYASCERAFNPTLEGKPIVVLSNNDGCIIARSAEAKKLKIPMGAPYFKWESFCIKHHVHVYSSNYELYGDMSHRVMTLLKQHCDQMEIYSIDEAFMLLEEHIDYNHLGRLIREDIKQATGIPVSLGFSTTKTLTKIANAIAKNETTSGVFYLNDTNMSILKNFPIEKIWGIGKNLSVKLQNMKIHTAEDLKNTDPKHMRKHFGVTMEKMINELRGQSCLGLESIAPRKQIISSRSFGKKIVQLSDLEEAISYFTAIACKKLRAQKSLASAVNVFLHTNHFNEQDPQYDNSTCFSFPIPTNDTGYIIQIAKKCIQHLYRKGYKYHKAGIILLDLRPESIQQLDFISNVSEKTNNRMKLIDSINAQYGKNTIFHCAEGIKRSWQLKNIYRSPRYTTQWEELLKVK